MFYILTQPGQVAVYPYTLTDLRRDNRDVSFPRDMAGFDTSPWHCHPVQPTYRPTGHNQIAERVMPELVDGVWQERWTLVDATPPVPGRVTMRQARLALLALDILDLVEPAIAAIEDPARRRAVEITWEYSTEVQRSNGFIEALAPFLGLTTKDDIDNVFRLAETL